MFGVIFFIFIDFVCPAFPEGFPSDASFLNASVGRKGHFYHHFSEQGRSLCKTFSCRGGGETPKRGPEKHLILSNWLSVSNYGGEFVNSPPCMVEILC